MNKLQFAEQFRRAVQMFIRSLGDEEAMEVASVFPPYEVGKDYKVDDIFNYGENKVGDPQLYRVVLDHTSQADWVPGAAPSLYVAIGLTEEGYPVWSQPVGGHDSYAKGDIAEHNGILYESLVDGNVWEPGVPGSETLWKVYAE